ncbi:MAG: type II secretion system protein GspM [Myxococcota bacterium]|jgi:general secretion pathway protein M
MAGIADLQATLQTSLATLSARERRMVTFAAVAVAVFLVFIITFTFGSKADSIRRRTAEKIAKLEEVQTVAGGYGQARAAQEAMERQLAASNVRLISYLEEKAQKTGIELPTINPKADVQLEGTKIVESAVEVTLTDVKLNRLVEFLTLVEAGPGIVKVRYMRLEPRVSNESITAWLTIATYHLKN